MKDFKMSAFLLVACLSSLADFTTLLCVQLKKHVPFGWKHWIDTAAALPLPGFVFGLFFGIACWISLRKSVKGPKMNEVFAMALICPLVEYLVPKIVGFAGVYLGYLGIPGLPVVYFIHGLLFATLARGVLFVELSSVGVFLTSVMGSAVAATMMIEKLPYYPSNNWYLIVGGIMGIWVAKQAR